jgi:hypothetical protein
MNKKQSASEIIREAALKALAGEKRKALQPDYIPTGLQEDIIYAVGCGKHQIVIAIDANKVGKTTAIINIAKNIIRPNPTNEYFGFWHGENVFRDWPYGTKRFRLTGTPTNLADSGEIQRAIETWWPQEWVNNRTKDSKHFYSAYRCDDWTGDALTYEQSPQEYEGPMLSLCVSDEPPKPALIGAINSRMAEGGIWVIGMTPISAGIFLDTMDDLKDKGKRICIVTGTIYENDKDTGKPNHNNTKRGLWTKAQIDDYVAGIPIDERPARLEGKASHKSGKVLPMFDQIVHVIDFDDSPENLKKGNSYMAIDPHRKYYPAIGWYSVRPDGSVIEYDEYPTFDDLGCFYEEVRNIRTFDRTVEQLANIILAKDRFVDGIEIVGRAIDPRFHAENPDFVKSLIASSVNRWITPNFEKIETQRVNLQNMLNFNPMLPVSGLNKPKWLVSRKCKNSIRAKARHYWEEGKDKESEQHKDFIDRDRYFLSICDGVPEYKTPKKKEGMKEIVDGGRLNPYEGAVASQGWMS